MNKSSIIPHSKTQQLVIIREDYLAICEGDHCTAALLNIFEYWTNIKLANREQAEIDNDIATAEGVEPTQDTGLWIYKRIPDFQKELLGLFGERKISDGLAILHAYGFIAKRTNPRFKWDKTMQYMLIPESIENSLAKMQNGNRKSAASKAQKGSSEVYQKDAAIPKTTTEATTEVVARESAKSKPFSKWQRPDVLAYYETNAEPLDKLVDAWGYMTRYKDLTVDEAILFARAFEKLEAETIATDSYSSLVVHARTKEGWKKDFSPLCLPKWVTSWRESRLSGATSDEQPADGWKRFTDKGDEIS